MIVFFHITTNPHHTNPNTLRIDETQPQKKNIFNSKILESSVTMNLPFGTGLDRRDLKFLHCGVEFSSESLSSKSIVEIVLLHGAKFTKQNWSESGIIESICNDSQSHGIISSVIALDLSVQADGNGFINAMDSLIENGILSGKPVVVISPSASGKAIISLTSISERRVEDIIRAWLPVASPAILSATNESLGRFRQLQIPILAINGNRDAMGKKVTERLVTISGAEGVEIDGGHPCYLDSPNAFVDVVFKFLEELVK